MRKAIRGPVAPVPQRLYTASGPNEEVATETACGASIGGARSFCAMKHVGLNVAADPLFTMSYIGVNEHVRMCWPTGRPRMHSSQNEQDSRNYARAAKVPMGGAADSKECRDFTKLAYELSEEFDTPVILRLTTRIAHVAAPLWRRERELRERTLVYQKTLDGSSPPLPAQARDSVEEARTPALTAYAETTSLNRIADNARKWRHRAAHALPVCEGGHGRHRQLLKAGLVWPLPEQLIRDFAAKCEKVYVVEELDDFIETHCKPWHPRHWQGAVPPAAGSSPRSW